jgi:hypothetical protein
MKPFRQRDFRIGDMVEIKRFKGTYKELDKKDKYYYGLAMDMWDQMKHAKFIGKVVGFGCIAVSFDEGMSAWNFQVKEVKRIVKKISRRR